MTPGVNVPKTLTATPSVRSQQASFRSSNMGFKLRYISQAVRRGRNSRPAWLVLNSDSAHGRETQRPQVTSARAFSTVLAPQCSHEDACCCCCSSVSLRRADKKFTIAVSRAARARSYARTISIDVAPCSCRVAYDMRSVYLSL